MISYATVEDFEAYVEGWTTVDEAALERLLERATRDVDSIVGPFSVDEDSGLKFGDLAGGDNPLDLIASDLAALSRAVCAQAEYRHSMGEEFFVRGQHSEVAGPDFKTVGELPYIGPKVAGELRGVRVLARSRGARARP